MPGERQKRARICLAAAASGSADLIDVEAQMEHLDAAGLTEKLHEEGCAVIASRHFFHGTPSLPARCGM